MWLNRMFWLLLLLFVCCGLCLDVTDQSGVCRGTAEGMVARGSASFRYDTLKTRYSNCSYIDGNLEIVFLDDPTLSYDLGFLDTIREVTGYVLILSVYASYVPLTNLRIIRGWSLYQIDGIGPQYSLYVALNSLRSTQKHYIGLRELKFNSLYAILRGEIYFHNNFLLCFANTLRWELIMLHTSQPPTMTDTAEDSIYRRQCGNCHKSCYQSSTGKRHCWGMGPDMCQTFNHGDVCNVNCDQRCFGNRPNECCHIECAGGCTGPRNTDCHSCRRMLNDGACEQICPPLTIYDQDEYAVKPNPDGRYSFGPLCVEECPDNLVIFNGACVKRCPKSLRANKQRVCEKCDGVCPKKCQGIRASDFVSAKNIQSFKNCTIIDGSLRILLSTFLGDKYQNIKGIKIGDLKVFENVKEITGYLLIQANHSEFRNLSFLGNLETILGRQLDSTSNSLHILHTPIESLELTNLKHIRAGYVLIARNKNLCYADSINFEKLFTPGKNQGAKSQIMDNKHNYECRKQGRVCDPQCADGCWGGGPDKCLSCRNKVIEGPKGTCVASCHDIDMLYDAGNNTCKPCHEECYSSCTGPTARNCTYCRHVRDGPVGKGVCLSECPITKYPNDTSDCMHCHTNCEDGCTGPSHERKWGGCRTCAIGIVQIIDDVPLTFCMEKDAECPDGYYKSHVFNEDDPLYGKYLCDRCHDECVTCEGSGTQFCLECKNYKHEGRCVHSCPSLMYSNTSRHCEPCHEECMLGCNNHSNKDCEVCRNFKVFFNESSESGEEQTGPFMCVQECPIELPNKIQERDTQGRVQEVLCVGDDHPQVMAIREQNAEEEKKKIIIIVTSTCSGAVIVVIAVTVCAIYCHKREKSKENTMKMTARLAGMDESEPLTPTDVSPDLAQLRLIKESELRKGSIIGSGAFGTVYKGVWIPDNEHVKIPVAIKVLQEGNSPNQNKELLEEARIMASVDHPCCVRIIAVCMTAQIMMITQLMPLGNLLEYVRKNRDCIGSKALLNWCTQIAKGMTYLEDRGIVHRDLAARNVLVQTPNNVKITDFGLAKLLNFDEEAYYAAGGKMPIKWLALECIQHRLFTHKSDIWSYGVTIWELFSYGKKPYENVRARDIASVLEKGERLPQPSISTIDVYMIMIKCWMLDSDSRPSFTELAVEFAKMARDPGRYIFIQGDKFMRLPSHEYDKNELVRNVSVAVDEPGEVIEAEDYLQPQFSTSDSNPDSPTKPLLKSDDFESCGMDERENCGHQSRREKRYGHLESAAMRRRQSPTRDRENRANSRYSSDPMKAMNNGGGYRDPNDEFISSPDSPTTHLFPAGVPPVPREMPKQLLVDDDDYLQPKSTNPAAYIDIMDSKGYYNDMEHIPECSNKDGDQYHYQAAEPTPQTGINNPEYFDNTNDPFDPEPPVQPLEKLKVMSLESSPLKRAPVPSPRYYNDVEKLESRQLLLDEQNKRATYV